MEQLKLNEFYRWQIQQLKEQVKYEQKAKARYIRAWKEAKANGKNVQNPTNE